MTRRRLLLGGAALIAACGPAPQPAVAPPPPGSAGSRKIVVIGGGISGLAIARDLAARGFDPTVLEASDRPGGRIHTVRAPFADGLYVEAGATHVVGDPELLKLMSDVGVEIAPRKPRKQGLAHAYLRGGKRLVLKPGEEMPPEFELSDEEKALGFGGRLDKYFALVKDVDPTEPLPASLSRYDALTATEFLARQGASPGYQESLLKAFAPDDSLERVSALALMRELCNFMREGKLGAKGGFVVGGTDRFPAAVAAELGKRVIYGARVRRIERSGAGVRVTFEGRGETNAIEADRAVCALPSTVLRDIEVTPALSPEKRRALGELAMVSVARVWLGTKARFWEAAGEDGRVDSDEPLGAVRHETELFDGAAAVLGLYATGAEARRVTAMAEEERIKTALAYASRSHPGIEQHFTIGASKCWDEDPLQRGAYARFAPGELTTLLPALAQADGRLHFAGDQTSYRPGFMHGALASARRVVDEIVRASV